MLTDELTVRIANAKAGQPVKLGRSKAVYDIGDGLCYVELIPSLHSFTFSRNENVEGTDALRLDFYEMAAARLSAAGIHHAFVSRASSTAYVALFCTEVPYEVIVKNVATGSTIRKYPGLFPEGHRFSSPIIKFDYRTDPEDQCLAEDYLTELGVNVSEVRDIALRTNVTLREWLKPLDLWDFCIVIGSDRGGRPCVISEISPDAMRLRKADGTPVDKDLFRRGASADQIIESWSTLIAQLRNS